MTALTEQQRAAYLRAAEYLNDATLSLHSSGMPYAGVVISVLYEASALIDYLREEGSSSDTDIAAIADAVGWLSISCADALVQPPKDGRGGH